MKYYIQRKDANGQLETVEEFETLNEARRMRPGWGMSDFYSEFYISSKPCKEWLDS